VLFMVALTLVSPSVAPYGCRFALFWRLCYNKAPLASAML
jgi:hypothetical protein